MEKRCTKCEQAKPLTEFDGSGRNGKMSYCKSCRREMRRANYVPHPRSRVNVQPGQRFGRLTVIEEVQAMGASRRVRCSCDCGAEKVTRLSMLLRGDTTSCGCLFSEIVATRNRSRPPGPSSHWLYGTWSGMMGPLLQPETSRIP